MYFDSSFPDKMSLFAGWPLWSPGANALLSGLWIGTCLHALANSKT